MADYETYKSYGSYIARLLVVFLGIVLIIAAFWYVISLVSDGDETAETNGPESSVVIDEDEQAVIDSTSEDEQDGQSQDDQDEDEGSVATSTDVDETPAAGANGRTLSTNTEDLPNTGPEHVVALAITPVLLAAAAKHAHSRYQLSRSYKA